MTCLEVSSVSVDWDCHLLFPPASPNLWLMDAELSAPVTISSDSQWLSGCGPGNEHLDNSISGHQSIDAGGGGHVVNVHFRQSILWFFHHLLAWKIIEWSGHSSSNIFSHELLQRKFIRKFRTRWTHWPCHEPLAQIWIVILCLSFVTIAPGATRLQPWEWGDNGKLFTSPVGDTSRQNFPLHSTKMPQFKFVWIKIMLQSCSYKSRKNWRPHVSFVCNQMEFSIRKTSTYVMAIKIILLPLIHY